MDTNLIAQLVAALANQPAQAAPDQTLMIVTIIAAQLGPLILSFSSYIKSREASQNTKDAKESNLKTEKSVADIHTAVNSERTVLLSKVEDLGKEILELTKAKAVLEENAREREAQVTQRLEISAAKASTPTLTPAPSWTKGDLIEAFRAVLAESKP